MVLMNLTGLELRVVGSEEDGLTRVTTFSNGSKLLSGGVAYRILQDLQFMMNFSVESIVVSDYFPDEFTSEMAYSNSTNSTIAYHLVTGNADIAIGLLYYVISRLKYGMPMLAFGSDPFYAYFQQPTNVIKQYNVFQKPFKPDLAVALVLIFSAIGILAELSSIVKTAKISLFNLFMKVLNGIGWAVATISQQAYNSPEHYKNRDHIKLLLYCGTLLSVWMYSYYSASILSYFTMNQDLIQKFSQLSESQFTVEAYSSVKTSLPTESANGFKYLGVTYYESVDLVFKGKHAHLDTSDLFFVQSGKSGKSKDQVCSVSKVKIDGGVLRSGFYYRTGFPHKEVFGLGILQIFQSGFTKKYFKQYVESVEIICPKIKKQYHDNLGLDELWILFSSYLCWNVISLLLLGVEKFTSKFCRVQTKLQN